MLQRALGLRLVLIGLSWGSIGIDLQQRPQRFLPAERLKRYAKVAV